MIALLSFIAGGGSAGPLERNRGRRAPIRPIVDGVRHRFSVSVAEVDHQNQWQRAAIGVAVVGSSVTQVREVLASIERFVVSAPDIELIDVETGWMESS